MGKGLNRASVPKVPGEAAKQGRWMQVMKASLCKSPAPPNVLLILESYFQCPREMVAGRWHQGVKFEVQPSALSPQVMPLLPNIQALGSPGIGLALGTSISYLGVPGGMF